MLLVDSDNDGTRDFSDIVKAIKKKCVVSSTYKSAEDIIAQLFEIEKKPKKVNSTDSDNCTEYNKKYDLSDSILIIDEAHNLINKENLIKLIKCFPKVLLLTATPPCQIEEIIGCETIYKYDFGKAIENKYICDYKIYLPLVEKKIVNIEQPVELLELDNDLCKKGLFVINGMLKTGSRRCIIYLSSIDECDKFGDILLDVMTKYHGLPCWVDIITSDISANARKTILDDFQSDTMRPDTFKFLCSVRILDEGVDIIKCDSVFITHIGNKENDIRIVQRICRANRIDKVNPNKVASCFLWCDDINRSLQTLQLLKDNDVNFNSKISIVNSNYDIGHEVKLINKIAKCNIEFTKFIDVKCLSAEEMWEFKKGLLFEFCDKYGKCVKSKELYKGYQIDQWLCCQKLKITSVGDNLYIKLSSNKIVKENLDEYLKYKETKKDKIKVSQDDLQQLFFSFCNENHRCPMRKELYQDQKVGRWFEHKKACLTSQNDEIYNSLATNLYAKRQMDNFLEKRASPTLTFDNWKKLLFEYANENKKCIQQGKKNFYNGHNLGRWFQNQLRNFNSINDKIYKILSENIYVKESLDIFLENRKI
jgi:hypothetical protein